VGEVVVPTEDVKTLWKGSCSDVFSPQLCSRDHFDASNTVASLECVNCQVHTSDFFKDLKLTLVPMRVALNADFSASIDLLFKTTFDITMSYNYSLSQWGYVYKYSFLSFHMSVEALLSGSVSHNGQGEFGLGFDTAAQYSITATPFSYQSSLPSLRANVHTPQLLLNAESTIGVTVELTPKVVVYAYSAEAAAVLVTAKSGISVSAMSAGTYTPTNTTNICSANYLKNIQGEFNCDVEAVASFLRIYGSSMNILHYNTSKQFDFGCSVPENRQYIVVQLFFNITLQALQATSAQYCSMILSDLSTLLDIEIGLMQCKLEQADGAIVNILFVNSTEYLEVSQAVWLLLEISTDSHILDNFPTPLNVVRYLVSSKQTTEPLSISVRVHYNPILFVLLLLLLFGIN